MLNLRKIISFILLPGMFLCSFSLSLQLEICDKEQLIGEWTILFAGQPDERLKFTVVDEILPHSEIYYEGCGDSGDCFHAEGWKEEIDLEGKDETTGYYPDTFQCKAYNHNKEENFDEWKGMNRNQKELEEQYKLFRDNHPDNNFIKELLKTSKYNKVKMEQ